MTGDVQYDKNDERLQSNRYLYILPVLFIEFLAVAMARALIPGMLVDFFGEWTYYIIGVIETIKGCLAFVASPFYGKLSDIVGRKRCLLFTVTGTTLPICSLAVVSSTMWTYVTLQSLAGCFAGTFPLVFAYIADFVPNSGRAAAYGLALAMYGLSHSIGPVAGGYIATIYSKEVVFTISIFLVVSDILYIVFILPESVKHITESDGKKNFRRRLPFASFFNTGKNSHSSIDGDDSALDVPFQWNPFKTLCSFEGNPLLRSVAIIVFLYYTGVWALVSTLLVYITRRFHFDPVDIGHLLGAYGACTVFAEGILVRYLVPWIGEKVTMQIGLLGFTAQCIMIGLADHEYLIYASMAGSLLSNLMYPAMSSLVSKNIKAEKQGEVLGTLNGLRALTEGFGPLLFSFLMSVCEDTMIPGTPYLIAGGLSQIALAQTFGISESVYSLGKFGVDSIEESNVELQSLVGERDSDIHSDESI